MFSLFSRNSERIENLKKIAYQLEMEFVEKDEYGLIALLRDFALFRRGHSKRIYNIIEKKDDWNQLNLRIFDYKFTVGSGKNSRTLRQTVFFMQSKKLGLPEFLMKPEHFFNKVGNYLGLQQDIDFENFPDFSDQYLLKGEDEEMVRYIMSNDLLQFFTIEKDWALEGINYYLIFYKRNSILSPEGIQELYEKGMYVYDLLSEEPPGEFL